MSYKFSKGAQVIGDLKAADDTQRDTKIDFGEDYIGLETSGSVRMVISGSDGKIGIGVASPSYKLDVNGDIRVRGNDIRDNSGNKAISFDGSANTTVVNNLTVQDYTFPASDGNVNQVLQTNGSGQLSFVDIDGGEGGDGGGGDEPTTAAVKVAYLSGQPSFSGGDTNEFFISWYNGTTGNQPDLRSNNQYFLYTNGGTLKRVTAFGSAATSVDGSNPFTNAIKVKVYVWDQNDSSDIAAGNFNTGYVAVATGSSNPTDIKALESGTYYHRAFYNADVNYDIPTGSATAVAVSIQGVDGSNNSAKGFNKLNISVHFQNI